MKTYLFALLTALVLNGGVVAQSHDDGDQNASQSTESTYPQQGMMNMHAHMQSMQEIMTELKEETDPEKFMVLMQKHMASMQEGMSMMGNAMGHQVDGSSENTTDTTLKENHPMSMINRMDTMDQKMMMMQKMMNQMMNHMAMSKDIKLSNHEH